ncbi:uncharacterized protein LOC114516948 [Dendronephthya gigantea]|uniref:uncharacterized protein LOC114516948 n=1 Tax=Dendronephthya gigantea TaxID=151771 RepID=UPI001068D822|nr:uncharacterized protein LOC114516948 [Dendronephthya gigantea]
MADPPEPPAPAGGLDVDLEVTNESIRLRFRCSTGVAVLLGVTGVTLGALYGRERIQPVIERLFNSVFGFCKLTPGSIVVDVDCFSAERVKELLDNYKCGKLKRRFLAELLKIEGKIENLRINFELKETLEMNTNRKSRTFEEKEEKQPEKTEEEKTGMSESEYLETLKSVRKLDGVKERLINLSKIKDNRPYNYRKNDSPYSHVINMSDEHGRTIFHYAAIVKNQYLFKHLLNLSRSNINEQDCDGRTALHLVCIPTDLLTRHEEFIHPHFWWGGGRLYICRQADINAKDSEDRTPLHYAAMYYEDHVETLIKECIWANIYDIDVYGKTPLYYAEEHGKTKAVELLKKGYYTFKRGAIEAAEKLLKAGASLDLKDAKGRTVAHLAAIGGDEKLFDLLFKSNASLNALDSEGNFPLYYAVQQHSIVIAEKLIKSGASVDGKNDQGETVLHLAAKRGDEALVDLLLKNNANVNSIDRFENTVLHSAICGNNAAIVAKLIKAGANIGGKNNDGESLLHVAAKCGDEKIIDLLLKNNGNVKDIDSRGMSVLHYAVGGQWLHAVAIAEKLIKAGASVDLKNNEGQTVLHLAAQHRREELVDLMLRNKVSVKDVDNRGNSILHFAVGSGIVTMVEKLIKAGASVKGKNVYGESLLHVAAKSTDEKMIDLLLKNNANASGINNEGKSVVYYAVERRNVAIVEKLLEAGAGVKGKDYEGRTVLHLAAQDNNEKMVDLLLKNMANVNDIDRKGNSALFYAATWRNVAIVEKLVEAGASVGGDDDKSLSTGSQVWTRVSLGKYKDYFA